MTIRLLVGIGFMGLAALGRAEDLYVAQTPRGAGDASSAANAAGLSLFNTAVNWSSPAKIPGKIGPGDTVHLVGTITSPLAVQAAGAPGSPITILFESGANLTSPAWPNGGAIVVGTNSYITIDGGANGIIQNTANGDLLANQVNSTGIQGSNANNLTVQNLSVANLYVRTSASGGTNSYGTCITDNCVNAEVLTNYKVTHCTLHDAYIGIGSDYGTGCSNYEFSFNTIYNCNWGGYCGDRHAGATMTGLLVHDNHIDNFSNWDQAADQFHHNGFYGWAESGGTLYAFSFYNNVIGPNYGANATAGLFSSGAGVVGPLIVYNNLLLENLGDSPDNGLIAIGPGPGASVRIYNNTMMGGGTGNAIDIGGVHGGVQNYDVRDNLCVAKTFIFVDANAAVALTSDYNDGYNLISGQAYSSSTSSTGNFLTLAQWHALGYDAHSLAADPKLAAGYQPLLGSPVIAAGANLSASFTTDKAGLPRPASSPWDIGAFQYNPNLPVFSVAPASPDVAPGAKVVLSAAATGSPAPTYQWEENGVPLVDGPGVSGSGSAQLTLTGVALAQAGSYNLVATNSWGYTVSPAADLNVTTTRLLNLSAMAESSAGGGGLSGGFVVSGAAKSILVRGIGPSLTFFGVPGVLADPKLDVYQGGIDIASNDNWGGSMALLAAFAETGAFSLPVGSLDSALIGSFAPGPYSAEVAGTGGESGIALVELYDTDSSISPPGRLVNLSARAVAGSGPGVLAAGFVVAGSGLEPVLIRGVGPTLATFGIGGVLPNPQIGLFQGSTLLQSAQGWGGDAVLSAAFSSVGAFALTSPQDAAMIVRLPAGSYSARVSDANGASGVALVEIYELPLAFFR